MKKKILGIFVCMLLIATALPAVGTMNKTIAQDLELRSNPQRAGLPSKIPDDVYFNKQWSLHNTGQTGGIPDCDIDAPEAWDIETGDPDVVIAIIDSGIDYAHPDLADKIWVNEDEIPGNDIDDDGNGYIDDVMGWNFFDDNNNPLDVNAHGTHCAGIAAAETDNGVGIAGICWDCKIMPLKKSRGMEFNLNEIIEAIEYAADNGADIISMSFGTPHYEESFEDAVDYAYDKGVFMCASAGNDNVSFGRYPAAFENVTAVAATDHNDSRMHYYYPEFETWCTSNYGDWVDVAAPGQQIYSTMPTYYCDWTGYGFSKNYDHLSGTSMAAPHVAGLAALLLARKPSLSPGEVKALICDEENVDPYSSTYDLGSGRINAYKALVAVPFIPDLSCDGSLSWTDVKPGDTVTGNFTVENVGDTGSLLDWEIYNEPDWGDWTFTPESGQGLTPEDGPLTVNVSVVAPDEKNKEFTGSIWLRNKENSSDYDKISAVLITPRNKAFNIFQPFLRFLEQHPNLFPILRQLLGL